MIRSACKKLLTLSLGGLYFAPSSFAISEPSEVPETPAPDSSFLINFAPYSFKLPEEAYPLLRENASPSKTGCILIEGSFDQSKAGNRSMQRIGYLRAMRLTEVLVANGRPSSQIFYKAISVPSQIGEGQVETQQRVIKVSSKSCSDIENSGEGATVSLLKGALDDIKDGIGKRPNMGRKGNHVQGKWSIPFASDSDQLSRADLEILKELLQELKSSQSLRIEISGSTDTVGAASYNAILAASRAYGLAEQMWIHAPVHAKIFISSAAPSQNEPSSDSQMHAAELRKVTLQWDARWQEAAPTPKDPIETVKADPPQKSPPRSLKKTLSSKPKRQAKKQRKTPTPAMVVTSHWIVGGGAGMAQPPSALTEDLDQDLSYQGYLGMLWRLDHFQRISLYLGYQTMAWQGESDRTERDISIQSPFAEIQYGLQFPWIAPIVGAAVGQNRWSARARDQVTGIEQNLNGSDLSWRASAGIEIDLAPRLRLSAIYQHHVLTGTLADSLGAWMISSHWESSP